MSTFPTILLATDGSPDARMAARAAVDLARRTHAALHVVHAWQNVYAVGGMTPVVAYPVLLEDCGRQVLAEEVAGIRAAGVEAASTILAQGPAAEVILDIAAQVGAGLILMGSRGLGGVRRVVMGNASEGVVHHATVPVLVMRGDAAAWPPRHVVAGDDGSPGAMDALRLAAEIAGLFGSRITVVRALPHLQDTLAANRAPEAHVVDDVLEFAQAELEDHAGALSPDVAARTTLHVSVEDPALALLATAAENSGEALVAVGCRGLGTMQRMRFGSVSTKVLRAAHGPVLVVPHAAPAKTVPAEAPLHVVAS